MFLKKMSNNNIRNNLFIRFIKKIAIMLYATYSRISAGTIFSESPPKPIVQKNKLNRNGRCALILRKINLNFKVFFK
jgi:hypothetical protein